MSILYYMNFTHNWIASQMLLKINKFFTDTIYKLHKFTSLWVWEPNFIDTKTFLTAASVDWGLTWEKGTVGILTSTLEAIVVFLSKLVLYPLVRFWGYKVEVFRKKGLSEYGCHMWHLLQMVAFIDLLPRSGLSFSPTLKSILTHALLANGHAPEI